MPRLPVQGLADLGHRRPHGPEGDVVQVSSSEGGNCSHVQQFSLCAFLFQALLRGTSPSAAGESRAVRALRDRRQLHGGDVRGVDEGPQERARLLGRLLQGVAVHRAANGRDGLETKRA